MTPTVAPARSNAMVGRPDRASTVFRQSIDKHRHLANLHGQVTELLALRFLDGTYQPFQSLPIEQDLCGDFGVSRTTIRGAIKELSAKGFVEVGPSRGTRVRPRKEWSLLDSQVMRWRFRLGVDQTLIRDIYELREGFEPSACRLAAIRGTREQHQAIARAFESIVATRDASDATSVAADVGFHEGILSSTDNGLIESLSSTLRTALRVSFEIARQRQPMSQADIEQHRNVKDAILTRSGEAAFQAMADLLAFSKTFQTTLLGDAQ